MVPRYHQCGNAMGSSDVAAVTGRMRRKSDLPSKVCPVCLRPFTWRRKWAKTWNEVRYCSEACRRAKSMEKPRTPVTSI